MRIFKLNSEKFVYPYGSYELTNDFKDSTNRKVGENDLRIVNQFVNLRMRSLLGS